MRLVDAVFSSRRGREFLRARGHNTYAKPDLYCGLLTGGGYIFTQPKTGTNYLCNVLAFYNSQLVQDPCFDFDKIGKYGVVRGVHKSVDKLRMALDFAATDGRLFFQTHDYYAADAAHVIVTSRNVLDLAVSSYHFH